ncbi:MAG: hypothetical protein ACXW16_03640 [Burkholderiaceae bacterium]
MFDLLSIKGLRAALLLCLLGMLTQAMPAAAQVTSINMTSDPGDYIGQGQTYLYTPADGPFIALVGDDNSITISFNTPTFNHIWSLSFAAANGAQLTQGSYSNAVRYPFQPAGLPGLSVSGDGRGCNELTGSFQVVNVVYGPGNTLASFDAIFEQHCEGAAPALRGQIRYNATNVALYLTAPAQIQAIQNQKLSFPVTATDVQLRRVFLTARTLPPGATFTDLGNNTGLFSWTPAASQLGTFQATFAGDNKQGNVALTTTQISVIPPPPANDDFAAPVLIPSSSARYAQNVTNATTAPDDPWCFGSAQSVWYAFTPLTNMRLEANTIGSGYDTALSVYTGSRGALGQIACSDDVGNIQQSRVRFAATAGTTYYFMASSRFSPAAPANLVFNLQPAPPPFSFNPTIAQFGSVVASTGAVTIRGSVQCSEAAYVTLSGQLKQKRGNAAITGYWSAFVACDGVTPWTATVQSQTVLFRGRSALLFAGGKAEVAATAHAFDPDTGEFKQVNLAAVITLRGK